MSKEKKSDTQEPAIPPSSSQLGNRAAQRIEQVNNHLDGDLSWSGKGSHQCINKDTTKRGMAGLPGVRRIVTDHTSDGKAIFGQDEVLRPANPVDPKGGPVPEGR